MFRLTDDEKAEVVTNCGHLSRLKFSPAVPYTFTEHGTIMAANVLRSKRAIEVSVLVVRGSVRLRRLLASHAELARKLDALGRKYDRQFNVVFAAIRELIKPPPERKKGRIGFKGD
jgi:hypothetical protein